MILASHFHHWNRGTQFALEGQPHIGSGTRLAFGAFLDYVPIIAGLEEHVKVGQG
mgnify:CR=1 FL=1